MHVKVIRNAATRTVRDDPAYYSFDNADQKAFARFKKDFLKPMRANLHKSLQRLVAKGATSMLEIGPGEGDGSDIAIRAGISAVSMVEIKHSTVLQLVRKYLSTAGRSTVTIREGDVRDVLPAVPSKSIDVGVIFDNTLSNMQEPLSASGLERDDFKPFVLSELARISRLSVIVGLSSAVLTPVYLQLGGSIIRETSADGKVSIFRGGMATQRYDDADIAALLASACIANATVRRDRGIYWIEIAP